MRRELTARYEANLRGLVTLLQARTSVAAHKAAVATMLGSMSLQVCASPACPGAAGFVSPHIFSDFDTAVQRGDSLHACAPKVHHGSLRQCVSRRWMVLAGVPTTRGPRPNPLKCPA